MLKEVQVFAWLGLVLSNESTTYNCCFNNIHSGAVIIGETVFYTKTQITDDYIYTIAVCEMDYFNKIETLNTIENIKKNNGIPYFSDVFSRKSYPVSITHHGRFHKIIILK